MRRALDRDPAWRRERARAPLSVVAAGKAAPAMLAGLFDFPELQPHACVGVGLRGAATPASGVEWFAGGHPLPDEGSLEAARRVLDVARGVPAHGCLLVLLSGGASALLASPGPGITLADKRTTIQALMHAGADIHELNTVRKHLSAVKGGRLAAACPGATLTLAISDVVGDDPSVIGSGPGVADASTWEDVAAVLAARGGLDSYPAAVRAVVAAGQEGAAEETPKPGAAAVARGRAQVVGGRPDALAGARAEATARGYHVVTLDEPVTGEARDAATVWLACARALADGAPRPACVISGGETTVTVTGSGLGGRNQEFALALAAPLAGAGEALAAASVGTDGIDGPTGAAGAMVDQDTVFRAAAKGLGDPGRYLRDNDSHRFFAALDDLVVLGPTDTNVGDLQILLIP